MADGPPGADSVFFMPYIQRDDQGKISALHSKPVEGGAERLSSDHPEVLAFLSEGGLERSAVQLLAATDTEVSRILEDLVDLLITKHVIRFTDLPLSAQEKLLNRRRARERLQGGQTSMLDQTDLL